VGENAFVEFDGGAQLASCVLRMSEGPFRKPDTGMGLAGYIGVAQQGQDGVVEGRSRDFDLAALYPGPTFFKYCSK